MGASTSKTQEEESPTRNNFAQSQHVDDKPVMVPVENRQYPPSAQQPFQYDEFGDYKLKYPLRNWGLDGPMYIPFLKPSLLEFQSKSEFKFAQTVASERENHKLLTMFNIVSTATVIALWFRGRHLLNRSKSLLVGGEAASAAQDLRSEGVKLLQWRDFTLIPLSASWFYWFYERDLLYGKLTTRVNMHAFNILMYEKARYIGTDEVVAAVLKNMEKQNDKTKQ